MRCRCLAWEVGHDVTGEPLMKNRFFRLLKHRESLVQRAKHADQPPLFRIKPVRLAAEVRHATLVWMRLGRRGVGAVSLTVLGLFGWIQPSWALSVVPDKVLAAAQVDLSELRADWARGQALALELPYDRADDQLVLADLCYEQALFWQRRAQSAASREWRERGDAHRWRARLALTPSRRVEMRAMLLDASSLPRTEQGVVALVSRLAAANFNVLMPEVYRRGYTVYPSGFTVRDPEFSSAPDVLGILIREAHARGLAVHPWIWTLRARSPGFGNPILGRLPGIAARKAGKDTRFISPASRLGRALMVHLVDDLSKRYPIDGLMLDYIRYDEEIPDDDLSRSRFGEDYQKKHGRSAPQKMLPGSEDWLQWQLWREQQVHATVEAIARKLRVNRPEARLSAAVFRGEREARLIKMQHWRHWANNRWIDWPAPMLYTAQVEELQKWVGWETDNGTRKHWFFPILGVHRMNQKEALLQQWRYLREQNAPGAMIFAMSHMDKAFLDTLKHGPFREPAILPDRNVSAAVTRVLTDLACRLATWSRTEDCALRADSQDLLPVLNQLRTQLDASGNDANTTSQQLAVFRDHLNGRTWDTRLGAACLQHIDYAARLLEAEAHRTGTGSFVPTSLPSPNRRAADTERTVSVR